jgi:hypothetical protein
MDLKGTQMSLVMDSKNWRGRAQLYGVKTQDRVVYIKGPRVGAWVWDSAKHPTLQKLEATVYQASLAASDTFQAKKQELEASGRYTAAGIRDELKRFADAAITPTLDKAKAELAEARRAVADRHSRIKPVAAESSNDPVSTMRKIEARTVLRTMPRQEIVRILAGANPDPIFVEAVLETQPFMVNSIGGALRAELERNALQRYHGPEIEELEVIDDALTLAAKATAVATEDIARELRGDDQPPRPQLVQTA